MDVVTTASQGVPAVPRPPDKLAPPTTAAPVAAAVDGLEAAGGDIVEGPSPAPNGARLIARHPDGAVFEYIETER